jgi:hypothetical protein
MAGMPGELSFVDVETVQGYQSPCPSRQQLLSRGVLGETLEHSPLSERSNGAVLLVLGLCK